MMIASTKNDDTTTSNTVGTEESYQEEEVVRKKEQVVNSSSNPTLQNPWTKGNPIIQKQEPTKIDFHSIMTQQQQEASEKLNTALEAQHMSSDYNNGEVTEEDLIRLAIEASLKDVVKDEKDGQFNTCAADDNNNNDDDDMDEEMKLAIQLSLAQANMENHSFTSTAAGIKMQVHNEINDTKLPAVNDIGKDAKDLCDIHTTKDVAVGDKSWDESHRDDSLKVTESHQRLNDATTSVASMPSSSFAITREEEEEIMKAIIEADGKEHAKSLQLAMELQEEENRQYERIKIEKLKNSLSRSNIRTVAKSDFEELSVCATGGASNGNITGGVVDRMLYSHADYHDHDEYYGREIIHQEYEDKYHNETEQSAVGYTINSSMPSKAWTKIDKNTIVGPNNEIRTKHDITLKNQSNADRLLGAKSTLAKSNGKLSVSDAAYNSFHQSLKNSMKRSMVKGVERSGTGRAENYGEKTRGGAMDGNVRLLITKAINNGLIQNCNGVVKEGKEAIVYHADAGSQSDGFDVAVKVFKRIDEFRNRSAYVDDDPRYHGSKFRNIDKRKQVEVWAEKEYRNLLRASRAGVAVPTPIMQKENVLFMRFLGEGGWPAAQLREIDIKRQSRKWIVLYIQILVAIRRLYHCARLVHADLSEYNILVCPMSQVENALDKSEEAKDDLQIALIDFGQAVERNHPSAMDLLKRDLSLVNSFFVKQDIVILPPDQCLEFILEKLEQEGEGEEEEEENEKKVENYSEDSKVAHQTEDDEESVESKEEWRHNIKGWDDMKDVEKLERMLAEIQMKHE